MKTTLDINADRYSGDVEVERLMPSGDIMVSALVSDGISCGVYRFKQRYCYYTKAEAVRSFREYCKSTGRHIADDSDGDY